MTGAQDKPDSAHRRDLDEAVTPISGMHAVPRTHRPTARATARKNWQGAGIVAVFVLLLATALAALLTLKDPAAVSPEGNGAQGNEATDNSG
jgi:hypothetical protein